MYNPKYNQSSYEYKKRELKRVPLDVQKDDYTSIKAAADAAGVPVNTWIKSVLFAATAAAGFPAPSASASPAGAPAGAPAGGPGDGASAPDSAGGDASGD